MKTIYFMSKDEKHLDNAMDYLNFACVLVEFGVFPKKSGIWMSWKTDDENDGIYEKLDERFELEKRGIFLTQGITFPESWLWTDQYDNILFVGAPEELLTYIRALYVFTNEGTAPEKMPEGFLYKMECESVDNVMKVISRGFIYHSEKDGK